MIHLLDTNVVSALMRGEPGPGARLLALPRNQVLVPQPVLAELRYGLARLPASKRRADLEERLAVLVSGIERAVWTDDVSRRFGQIKADLDGIGQPIEDFDVAIAAHALTLEGVLVTRNTKHFARVAGLRLEAWP